MSSDYPVDDAPREPLRLYFDVVSPFAYFHLTALEQWRDRVEIEYVPVLLAGLLKHWGQLGPAEIPGKRVHIYRHCTWMAQQHQLPFRFPPRHPFNPLPALRLMLALGATATVVRTVFGFIFGEGRDIGDAGEWNALCARLDVRDASSLIGDSAVKQQLLDNTNEAISAGVFGVPTVRCRDQLFWGYDSLDMLRDFLDDPSLFETPEMRRLYDITAGAERRR